MTSGNNSTWYLQPTAGSQAYVLPCYQPNMVEMGDYYLAECEEDLSILDFNAGTRTTLVANAWPYTGQNNPRLLWSVEADGTRYYMLKNGSMYEFDEVARDLVYITSIQSLGAQGMQFVSNTNTCFDCLPLLNGEFYFHLKTTMGGQNQIWKSDGTAIGTVPVANISSTYMVGDDFLPFVYNGEIYYSDFASGTTTLSASDGTVSGTRIVHQDNALRPLATSMKYGATFNGEYYYLQQYGIVKTDGTAAGTAFIADCPELYMSNPRPELFVFDQNLYWIGECLGNTGTGNELYKFDGTSASLVANFVPDSSTNSVDGVSSRAGYVNFKVWNETHFAFDGGVDNCHPNYCEMDDLYISDGTSSGTVVIMDGHLYAHETQNKHSIIGSVVYHSSSRSHGTEWCYTDLTGVRANPINGSSAPAEVCFGVASGQHQTHHGYVASFNIDDTLVILMRPANHNYGNYGAGMQYYSYAPNNITISTPPPVIWSTDPALPSGIGISNGVISGTPTVASSNTTYTVTATINNITLQTDIWLSSSAFAEITSTVDGAALQLGETMTPITLDYTSQHTGSGSPFVNTTGPVGSAENAGIKIAVDSNGHKHIIHGRTGDGTIYATDASGTWLNTTLLPYTCGRVVDIAVDSNDNVHVIAKDSNGNLGYMTNAGGSWSAITTIDNTVPTGWEANMAIDLFDNIHVSYYDGSAFNGNLKYANNIGGSWTTKFVDNTPTRSGKYNSITTDSNGYVHISYSRDNPPGGRDIYYATNLHALSSPENASFNTRALNVGGFTDNSIALDSNDVISIVFQKSSGGIDLASCSWVYAYYPCTSSASSTVTWTNTPLNTLTGIGVSAAFDSNDNLHMNYVHNSMLYHSTNASGAWVDAVIDTPQAGHFNYNDLAVDSGDNVHSSYLHYETITVQNAPVTIWTALYMGIEASGSGASGGSSGGSGGGGSGSGAFGSCMEHASHIAGRYEHL